MFKLARYLKRYIPFLVVALILLSAQAMLDLNLPNKMSDIVNTGIQKGGIEEIAPTAITEEMMSFFSLFMSEEDKATIQDSYTRFEDLSAEKQKEVSEVFLDAKTANAFVITAEGEDITKANAAFGRADYAFMLFLQDMAGQGGTETETPEEVNTEFNKEKIDEVLVDLFEKTETETTEAEFDLEALKALMPNLAMMPPEAFAEHIKKAGEVPEMMAESVAAIVNKSLYKMLGTDTDKIQIAYIMETGLVMIFLALAVVGCAVGAGYCFSRIGAGVARDLRNDVYKKVSSFTNAEMDEFSTSSLITRTTNDVTNVQMMYTMGMRMVVYAPIMGIGGIIMALEKSASMSWIIAVAVALLLVLMGVITIIVMPKFKEQQGLLDRLTQVARENLSGIMVVRAFSNQEFQENRFDGANTNLNKNQLFTSRAMAVMMPIMMLLFNGISLTIVWVGAKQIAASAMQVGDMMAFIQYSMQVIMSFLFIAMIFIMVPRATVSAGRINEVLKSKSIVLDPETPQTLDKNVGTVVDFKNVSFRYKGAEEYVLHDINFTAKPGETTAFIGSTGSGKSTLINLVPRFYDVSDGSITINGIDIRNIKQEELRENIGYVPQKGLLFAGDIESNLRYGDENASQELMDKAIEISQASDFVSASDDGLATSISQGGSNVSGGQRQRLSIARALVKQAPIYIFDDSFSALDFATDAKLRAALKPYTAESVVLVVAQRIGSIRTAEQIIVLDEGRIVGKGRHEELMKTCAAYKEIAESQLSEEELA